MEIVSGIGVGFGREQRCDDSRIRAAVTCGTMQRGLACLVSRVNVSLGGDQCADSCVTRTTTDRDMQRR